MAGPSPANTLPPRLPTYPASTEIVARQLVLHRDVERVDVRRPLLARQRARKHAVRQRELAVRGNRREHRRRRTLREVEHALEVLRRVQLLHRQHRQVLRHAVAEQRSEDADVEASAVTGASTVFSVSW